MEIKIDEFDDLVELHVHGVLDSNWSDHLSRAIDEAVRGGSHRMLLNLSGVNYLSSAGISVLLRAHAQLTRIHGFFAVSDPSPQVREVLKLTGLQKRLICDDETLHRSSARLLSTSLPPFFCVTGSEVDFELYDLDPENPLRCRMFGDPARLPGRQFLGRPDAAGRLSKTNLWSGPGGLRERIQRLPRTFRGIPGGGGGGSAAPGPKWQSARLSACAG